MELDTGTMDNALDDYAGDHTWICVEIRMEHHLYGEIRVAPLTSENLALHDLFHGRVAWIVRSEYSHSSDEVMVQGQPVRRASYNAYCHCGRCNWSWFLQGWVCWPAQQ